MDGSDENREHSGATSIYKDNNFKKLLLMPKSLKNTCLIYNGVSKDFYHCFKLVKKNTFRKAISFSFQQTMDSWIEQWSRSVDVIWSLKRILFMLKLASVYVSWNMISEARFRAPGNRTHLLFRNQRIHIKILNRFIQIFSW